MKKSILFASLIVTFVGHWAKAEPAPSITWKDCRIEAQGLAKTVNAGCETFSVSENRLDTSAEAKTIDLNMAIVWSWNNNRKQDPVLFLAGGPGQSAVESFVQVEHGFRQLIQERNIILVDQRGTGKSNPLNCQIEAENISISPTSDESLALLKECVDSLDADTRYYTTTESIKDLEEVRKALKIEKWNLIGVSYGTRKALTYAKLFPNSIRTMILDGVVPQQEDLGGKHEENLLTALTLQFSKCEQQSACHKKFGDVQSTLDELLKQSDETPLKLTLPDPISGKPKEIVLTREVLSMIVRMFSYSPETFRLLPLLLDLAKNDQPENLASQGLMILGALSESISVGMDMSVLCAEDAHFYSKTSKPAAFFSKKSMAEIRKKQCEIWPHIDASPSFKEAVKSDIPTLLLSGELDPVTPPSFAEITARTLTNSQHLVAKGFGHGVFMRGCMSYVIRDFVDDPEATLDTNCMDSFDTPPFFIDLMGPKQ